MTDHPNAVTARTALNAFNAGDIPAMIELLDDAIVWHAPGTSRFGGQFEGKQAVMDRFRRMAEADRAPLHRRAAVGRGDHRRRDPRTGPVGPGLPQPERGHELRGGPRGPHRAEGQQPRRHPRQYAGALSGS